MTDTVLSSSNILFVTQRLSDFMEMQRTAVGLRNYGHRCIILFCGVGSQIHDDLVIEKIDQSIESREIDGKIVFSQPQVVISTPIHKIAAYFLKKQEKKIKKRVQSLENSQECEQTDSTFESVEIIKINSLKKRLIRALIKARVVHYFKRKCIALINICRVIIKKILISFLRNRFISFNNLVTSKLIIVPLIYKKSLKQYKEILKAHNIKLIILPEDIVGYVSPLLIKAGHKLRIPSMIIPYTIANQTEAFQALKTRPEFSLKEHFSHRIIGALFPSWVMKDESHAVLRLPAGHVLGHIITRSSPPNPWMMNSTYANIIAVENEQMLKYYKQNGIPPSKMKITGACYDDNLAAFLLNKFEERKKLYNELNINSDKPFLLIGGFPNQLTGGTPPGFDFADAEEAVDFIGNCLRELRNDYEIIFRPHPNYLELGELFAKKNFLVTHIDTARLVALSDIYIAFASATIRWAISCGIPTINYDIFYYDFSDYKHVQGVLNVCAKDDFRKATQMISEPEQLLSLKTYLETEKLEWGYMDGGSTGRIQSLVQELLQTKKIRRKAS